MGSIPGTPSWDLAFHCIPFALIDPRVRQASIGAADAPNGTCTPNGQIPAYEWAFSDVNPPVHAWAAWRVYQIDRKQTGGNGDLEFSRARVFTN